MVELLEKVCNGNDWVYPCLVYLFWVLVSVNLGLIIFAIVRKISNFANSLAAKVSNAPSAPQEEVCPTCLEKLVDGECPKGHTIVRCQKCGAIMKDGLCPRCGVQGEVEFCPTCNSELVDGECPRGHTIVRCPDCGAILQEGICPRGCNSDPLNLGWPGGMSKVLSPFALKVIAPEKYKDFTVGVPASFIVGRSASEAKEAFVELLMTSKKDKAQCSRQYIRMDLSEKGDEFTVTLLNSSGNPAVVDGDMLKKQDSTAKARLGSHIKLNPGYELEIVANTAPAADQPKSEVAVSGEPDSSNEEVDDESMAENSQSIDQAKTIVPQG